MPELPEVETTKRGIEPFLEEKSFVNCITNNPSLRIPFDSNSFLLIKNKRIKNITRIAKYISIEFSNNSRLIIHLGMTGTLRVSDKVISLKHDHIIFGINDGKFLIYNDPRRFGLIKILNKDEEFFLIDNNGPDPFEKHVDAEFLFQKIKNRKTNVKAILLNNKIISGIGNIYASEILFDSKISPKKLANRLTVNQCQRIIKSSKRVLNKAIKAGGTTLKDYFNAESRPGYFKNKLFVYGRDGESCKLCKSKIKHIVQNNRSTYFCTTCQRS